MKTTKNNRRNQVIVEAVEPRQLMAANIFNFAGTSGNDEITIRYTETTSGDILIARVNGNLYQHHTPDVASISISGLGGHDRITWDDNRRNFNATFPVFISGGAGDDSIILGGEGTYDPLFLRYAYTSMNGDDGVDRIVMDASMLSDVEGTRTEISADYISPYGAVGSNYYGIEQIDFKAPQEGRDLLVKSLNATTAVNVLNNNLNSKLTIGAGDLDTFKGIVNFNGVGGTDSVIVNDSSDTNGRTYNLESNKITFNTGGMVFLNNSDAVTVQGSKGPSTYRVNSTGAGRPVTISPGAAVDVLEVGGGNYTANIKAQVTFWDDTSFSGFVYINDNTPNTNADTVNISGGQFSKPGLPSTMWAYAKQVTYSGGAGANNITVTPSTGVSFKIDGNGQPAGTADTLSLNLTADETAVRTGTGTAGQYVFANKKPVVFEDIETAQSSTNLPVASIDDRVAFEAHSGSQNLEFTVSLSKPLFVPVTLVATPAGNTATANEDFLAQPLVVTFAAGETSKKVAVKVFGDSVIESDESFSVQLGSATNATLGKSIGYGVILNDDTAANAIRVAKESISSELFNEELPMQSTL